MDRPGEHLYHLWLTCCPFSTWAVHIVLRFFHVISPARHAQPDANVVKTHDAACGRALKPLNGWGIVAKRKCRFRCSHGNGESRCTISLHPPHFYTIRTIWLPSHLYPLYLYIYTWYMYKFLVFWCSMCPQILGQTHLFQVGEAARSKSKLTDLVRSAVVLARSATW